MSDGKKSPVSPDEIARLEAQNGILQFDRAIEIITYYLDPSRPFSLRPHLLQELQSVAVTGLIEQPGQWRKVEVKITESRHNPPPAYLVAMHITEMCEYINNNWHEQTPLHLASYIMWRLNWIHPFEDGNGRTARIISFVLLNLKLGYVLPGSPTIPDQIVNRRDLYLNALGAADESLRQGNDKPELTEMENMLRGMLAEQLLSVINKADGAEEAAR